MPPRSSGATDAEQAVVAYDASKEAVASLAIDLTGQTLVVDGGVSALDPSRG